ncbi:Signal transduction histidine-protein kinase AtoS [subsurface metagenome]
MAYEIDSPLQAINAHLSTMKSKYKDEKEHSENIELLKKSFDSIRNTVKNLLNLSHPGIEHRRPTNINRIIENTISLLNNYLKKSKIKVILELSPRIPEILASSQQIGQVCTNLINNSIEALTGIYNQDTGRNTRTSKRKKISIKTNYSKRTIIIKVSDNGPGIHKKDLDHIFDPFFTTRKKLGMGLGLSICYIIIEDHKGSIHVKNLPDAGGLTFTITLPVD